MNKRTIYTLPKDTEITGQVVADLIKTHETDKQTYTVLESYIDDSPRMTRDTPNDLLAIHNYAEYIVDTNVGYLLGNPVSYKAAENLDITAITEAYKSQSMDEVDSDIGEDCSMFGQAFENIFLDEEAAALSAKLSVYNTIVVYDDTFKHNKMFAIYYAPQTDKNGKATETIDVTIWTASEILYRTLKGAILTEVPGQKDEKHYFKEVPVVHYMNNKRLKGDFESVTSLIDAYNILQSDRVIDREKLVDAILAFYGASLKEEDRQAIKDNRVVGLPDGAKAEYIVKNIDEGDTDVLRKVIASDIHKFSKTPDFSDETFGDAPSGVSLKYKILSLEWNAKKKERQFEAGLLDRFRLYATILSAKSKTSGTIDANSVDVVFTRSLPQNDLETSQMINNLERVVSDETLVGQLSFVDNASKEVEKTTEQKELAMQNSNFGTGNFIDEESE